MIELHLTKVKVWLVVQISRLLLILYLNRIPQTYLMNSRTQEEMRASL